ncbi:MAG TPA: hypothetical protein VGG36_08765 [Rhizomicrobium sp.]|jgi:hypothetical protein
MRAVVLTGLLLLTASAVHANPLSLSESQRLTLPSADVMAGRYALVRARAQSMLPDRDAIHVHYTPSQRGFGIGPLRADGTDSGGLGRRHGLKPHYRLEGVRLLGGSIGGSIDGRGAMLSLHWGGNN